MLSNSEDKLAHLSDRVGGRRQDKTYILGRLVAVSPTGETEALSVGQKAHDFVHQTGEDSYMTQKPPLRPTENLSDSHKAERTE